MSLSLIACVALLLHLCGIVTAMHAVMKVRTPQGAVAWALGLVVMPYLTLLPYLFLGASRFRGYARLRQMNQQRRRYVARQWPGRADYLQRHLPPAEELQRFQSINAMLQQPFYHGHQLCLLVDGEATFEAIFEAIAQAEHVILIQFFIIHDDQLGQRLQRALLERAAAGVQICVLYDGVGSHALPRRYVDTLRQGGVRIHAFATRRWRNRLQLNFRNHRKIVLVDGWRAFVGGLNVGDEYMGRKPPLAPWRDTHMELQGPAVADVHASFLRDWRWVTGELPPFLPPRDGCGTATTLVAATGPADRQETCSLLFVTLINAATRRIWLTSPYFVPDLSVFSALRLAVLRGVDVRILIPSRPDHLVVFLASSLHAAEAHKAGIKMFRLKPGFVHQKVALIDHDTSMIGSMNLDNRSFRLNFEISALNIDVDFAQQVEAMLEHDFAQSVAVTSEEYQGASFPRRLAMNIARLMGPIL
ncbi:cardiolipin synthase [Frateuria aurantia]